MEINHDPVWESIYASGKQLNRYPFDSVVSFLFHFQPNQSKDCTSVLEVGCGAGNNLWFAAREGWQVYGIDGSASAIHYAQQRFLQDTLSGKFQVGDFTSLPYADGMFDFVLDRCATTHTHHKAQQGAINEIHRTLKPGGHFLFVAFSDHHTSAQSGSYSQETGLTTDITNGSLRGVGQVNFLSLTEVHQLFPRDKWEMLQLIQHDEVDLLSNKSDKQSQWRVIARKK